MTKIRLKNHEKETNEIPEISTEELQNAIKRLKKGKAGDSNVIRAEDIKASDDEPKEMVRTDLQRSGKQEEYTPEAWKENNNKK